MRGPPPSVDGGVFVLRRPGAEREKPCSWVLPVVVVVGGAAGLRHGFDGRWIRCRRGYLYGAPPGAERGKAAGCPPRAVNLFFVEAAPPRRCPPLKGIRCHGLVADG